MSDVWAGPGYWLASDGKWYAPELHPSLVQPPAEATPETPEGAAPEVPTRYAWGNGLSHSPVHSGDPGSGPAGWSETGVPPRSAGADPYSDLYVSGPTEPQRRKRIGRRPLAWGAAALGAVVAVVGILVAVSGQNTRWDPKVLGIVHFVEKNRGLSFKRPVNIEFLAGAQFDKEVSVPTPTSQSDRTALRRTLSELRALGLVHGNVNLASSENALNQADVVGLYVDAKKTVFVRGTKLTPYVRVTLAHELTHALQDQYFDLTTLDNRAKGDQDALTALVEGDAVRVQDLYEQQLSAADKRAYQKSQNQIQKGSGKTSNVPEILGDIDSFPYAFGPTFVDSLDADGGTAGINRAFRKPPVAEAQIVDPVKYPLGWKPARVPPPPITAGERRLDKPSSFGQVSLFEVLGGRLGYDKAWAAVQGWQGDNSVPYEDHGHTCIAVDVAMGSAAATTQLTQTADQWAQGIPGAVVSQTGRRVELRSCDPGPSAPAPPKINPSAFDVLSARAEIIDGFMTSDHADFALGACIADHIIVGVGPSAYGELTANTLSASQEAQLRQLVVTSAQSCQAEGVS